MKTLHFSTIGPKSHILIMHSEAGPCAEHTDNMVELRYSLWRVPMALHAMVTAFEEEKVNKVWHKKIEGL